MDMTLNHRGFFMRQQVILGDPDLLARVKQVSIKIADAASEGLQSDGSLAYEKDLSTGHVATERSWWPQSEAIVGYP